MTFNVQQKGIIIVSLKNIIPYTERYIRVCVHCTSVTKQLKLLFKIQDVSAQNELYHDNMNTIGVFQFLVNENARVVTRYGSSTIIEQNTFISDDINRDVTVDTKRLPGMRSQEWKETFT